ncbi:hypothetical protein ASH02_02110 [Nocardioides sp. Soil796]|nr:hypothetical protein ASH02_02110 [Nocardioides sp. Soil796]
MTPGDLTDPESLAAACQGVTAVVATATMIARRLAGATRPTIHEADEQGMASLIAAAESAGVRRFVYLSFPGVEKAIGTPLERAKLATEERLRGSAMQRVIIRSDAFQEIHFGAAARFDVAAGKITIIGRGDSKRRWVSTGDIAALVASAAVEPDPPSLITVGGPEAMTKNEAVAFVEEVAGRRMKVQHMPRPIARMAIRLLNKRNDALASAFGAGLLQDIRPADWDDAALRERGITPRTASDFLRQQAESTASHG